MHRGHHWLHACTRRGDDVHSEVAHDHTFTVGDGQWVVHNECGPLNSKGVPYPEFIDPRTGKPAPFPEGDLGRVPPELRAEWTNMERAAFIKEWYDRGYRDLPGGWSQYDIHHILPREFGGGNDFWNLVPVERGFHNKVLTPWWKAFKP